MDERRLLSEADDESGESSVRAPFQEREIKMTRAIALFLIPALGGLLFGYDIGATSGAIKSITSATMSGTNWFRISAFQEGLIVSSALFGGMAGSIGAAIFGTSLGRKREILLAALLYAVGTAFEVLSNNSISLCIGRLIYGGGIGFAMHGAPSYIAETAPSSLRGTFISLKEALIVSGILLGYFVSFGFVNVVGGWRWNYGLAFPVILIFGIGMLFLPESPRLLVLKGKLEEAKAELRRVYGKISNLDSIVDAETREMFSVVDRDRESKTTIFDKRNWKALYITLSLVIFQQATGQPSVLYYAQKVFEKVNLFPGASGASTAAIGLGICKLLSTLFAASFVENKGRRTLLLLGVTSLTVALLVLSFSTSMIGGANSIYAWSSVIALILYVASYQISFGPVVWLLVGELIPLQARTKGIALCTFTNFGVNFLVSLLFPVLTNTVGLPAEYAIFAAIGVLSVTSIYLTVPETKGKSLEEIETLMTT